MKALSHSLLLTGMVLAICCPNLRAQQSGEPPAFGLEQSLGLPSPSAAPKRSAQPGEKIADWQARLELARVLSYVQRYPEAISQYRQVLKEKPEHQQARLELAKVLFWAGRSEEALQAFQGIPRDELSPEARIDLADIYVSQKEYERAISLYREHLQNHPEDDRVRFKLAEVLSWRQKYEEALKHYRIILEHRPEDIQVRRKLSRVLIWNGEYDRAIEQLRRTLPDS